MQSINERPASFIIGFSDGLILPLLLITILTRLTENTSLILLVAAPSIALFALVMGISNYYTRRNHTNTSIRSGTFKNIGLSSDLEEQLLKDHEQEKQEWEQVLKEHEAIASPDTALSWLTGLAYLISGFVVLVPFLFLPGSQAYKVSCMLCGILIVISGFLKAGVTDNHPLRVIGRNLIYTALLCGLAYAVTDVFTK